MLKTNRSALRRALALILISAITANARLSRLSNVTSSSLVAPPTCPARSVNYITESLPQQCLQSPWPNARGGTNSLMDGDSRAVHDVSTHLGQVTVTATLVSQNTTQPTTSESTGLSGAPTARFRSSDSLLASSTTGTSGEPSSTEAADPDGEGESPLDNANFLSFEEWKRQNLAKAGQSADHVGHGRPGVGEGETRRRPGSINNALDSLGEDTEIEIDFGGFVNQASNSDTKPTQRTETNHEASREGSSVNEDVHKEDLTRTHARSKDAGRTCKERSNYASFDCAATVLKTNPECKGSTSVLVENKDSYMLNECSAKNKFLIVELCNDILVDTVVLANFEFFSSMFRTFKVSVSDRYPVKLDKWRELGTFEARNSRQVQAFLVENPLIWARYLRIEFLTHFGNEYYCPVSLLRVHGTTMMEEFNHDVKGSKAEEEIDGDAEGAEKDEGKASDVVTAENMKPTWTSPLPKAPDVTMPTSTESHIPSPVPLAHSRESPSNHSAKPTSERSTSTAIQRTPMETTLLFSENPNPVCKPEESPENTMSGITAAVFITQPTPAGQPLQQPVAASSVAEISSSIKIAQEITILPSSSPASPDSTTSYPDSPRDARNDQKSTTNSSQSAPRNPSSSTRPPPSSIQPPPSNPTTQESFFKSVHKRLQLLESNSTLSLQYIEEQSRILRDAFAKVEKRQLAKTTAFLDTLNSTVLNELREFRHQYDQLWQSTVLELSSQRTQTQQEIVALSSRLTILADEVMLHKRIAIVQFLLILVCLGLVLFSRSSSSVSTYLELPPVVQHAFNKSSSSLSKYTTHFDTPPGSPSSTRPPSRYGFSNRDNTSHGRGPSEGSGISDNEESKAPNIACSPPTPTSEQSDEMNRMQNAKDENSKDLAVDSLDGRQTQSSSATPRGRKDEELKGLSTKDMLGPG